MTSSAQFFQKLSNVGNKAVAFSRRRPYVTFLLAQTSYENTIHWQLSASSLSQFIRVHCRLDGLAIESYQGTMKIAPGEFVSHIDYKYIA